MWRQTKAGWRHDQAVHPGSGRQPTLHKYPITPEPAERGRSRGRSSHAALAMSDAQHDATLSHATTMRRPVSITLLGWILILGGAMFLLMIPLTWSEVSLQRNLWNTFSKVGSLACGVGLLGMRRWAVVFYFALFSLSTVLLYAWPPNRWVLEQYSQPSNITIMVIVPAVVAAITLPRWNTMRW